MIQPTHTTAKSWVPVSADPQETRGCEKVELVFPFSPKCNVQNRTYDQAMVGLIMRFKRLWRAAPDGTQSGKQLESFSSRAGSSRPGWR